MNRIFVFGSNLAGRHGKGAALIAKQQYGALHGVPRGRYGNSYAIPIKDAQLQSLDLDTIHHNVAEFLAYARQRPYLEFKVTCIGCGLAGYDHAQIAPMFDTAPFNCRFDTKWQPWLGAAVEYWGTY